MMTSQEVFGLDRGKPDRHALARPRLVKRGERLEFRRRQITPERVEDRRVLICCGGREFSVTSEMAESFLRKARLTLECHTAELIPILHTEGLELLFIAENIPFTVGATFAHNPLTRDA